MALKDILVYLDTAQAAAPELACATALASRHGAHLTGLHVLSVLQAAMVTATGDMPAAMVERLVAESRRTAMAQAEALRQQFEAAAKASGVDASWQALEGSGDQALAEHGHYADLLVFGRQSGVPAAAEAAMFAAGRPLLVTPPQWHGAAPSRVLVAWHGGREAARAVHDSLPLLVAASEVKVLSLPSTAEGLPAAKRRVDAMAVHLARHGVKVVAAVAVSGDLLPEDVLLNEIADGGFELLVMGGYGHTRLREMLLGGVTRHMLGHAPVPVLLSH